LDDKDKKGQKEEEIKEIKGQQSFEIYHSYQRNH
jgi:hypothetical protein